MSVSNVLFLFLFSLGVNVEAQTSKQHKNCKEIQRETKKYLCESKEKEREGRKKKVFSMSRGVFFFFFIENMKRMQERKKSEKREKSRQDK